MIYNKLEQAYLNFKMFKYASTGLDKLVWRRKALHRLKQA